MAGFFRQTAQRAQASGSRLHSSAALPYAAARDRLGEAASWTDEALSAPVAGAPRLARAAENASPAAPAAIPHGIAAKPSPRKVRRTNPVPKSKAKPAPRANTRTAKTPRAIVERVMSLAASASLRPAPAPIAPPPAPAAEPAPLPAAISPLPAAAMRRNKPFKPQTRLQSNAGAKRTGASARRAQAAAPEVHIHIGRVELAANAPAAAAPKRSAAGERRPLSLDDYLQQRRSRRAGGP